jgi:hypothetical protein
MEIKSGTRCWGTSPYRWQVWQVDALLVAAAFSISVIELVGAVFLRAVEHHVLEEVRNAGCPGPSFREPMR